MTNLEKNKCENLCIEAIKNLKEAQELYELDRKENKDCTECTINLRRADMYYNYAIGINQVLVRLGYKSENMEELSELI